MAKVSLNKASKETGVPLVTLSRWVKKGRISAEKQDSGGYLMDTSEYTRITDLKKSSPNMKHSTKHTMVENATPNEIGVLHVETNLLREIIDSKDKVIEDLRNQRDDLSHKLDTAQETVTRQTYLLEHHQKATEKPPEAQEGEIGIRRLQNRRNGLVLAFIALLAIIIVIVMTRGMWTPFVESLLNR